MNLGQFREQTKNLSDDVELIATSDNFELRGNWVTLVTLMLPRQKKNLKVYGRFDHTSYSKEVYIPNEDGEVVIKYKKLLIRLCILHTKLFLFFK